MVIPTFDEIMFPILETIKDGKEYKASEISDNIEKKYFNLTDDERKIRLNNGRTKFYDRLLWARTYLKKAGLVEYPRTGGILITKEGKNVADSGVKKINNNYLMKYKSFKEFKEKTNGDSFKNNRTDEDLSPQDLIENGYEKLISSLEQEMLEKLKSMNPYLFEKVVLELLKAMSYGEFIITSKSGDGGIDGIINQDELGLEKIFIQCKRFKSNCVREPDIRNFIGAMSSDASKGIFVTTSYFNDKAFEKARTAPQKIILINGMKLAKLMVKHKIGIQVKTNYELKEIDNDFFEE